MAELEKEKNMGKNVHIKVIRIKDDGTPKKGTWSSWLSNGAGVVSSISESTFVTRKFDDLHTKANNARQVRPDADRLQADKKEEEA